jgi:GT2 family glycosyltransferase
VLFLNPDTTVHPGMLDALRQAALRRPEARIWGGRNVTETGALDKRSCAGIPTVWSTLCFGLGLSSAFRDNPIFDPESLGGWQRDDEREVGMVVGSLLMIDKGLFDALGGFDSDYFMYGEDLDLCMRARQHGARPIIVPDAVITHVVGASSTNVSKRLLLLKGKATCARRHSGPLRAAVMVRLLSLGVLVRAKGAALRMPQRASATGGWPEAWDRRAEWQSGY